MKIEDGIVDRVMERRNEMRSEVLSVLQRLVGYQTVSLGSQHRKFHREATACQEFLADCLASVGLAIKAWDVKSDGEAYPTLVGHQHGRGGGRSLTLNGHFDVVSAGEPERWSADPWSGEVRESQVVGRGTADMKGGVTAIIIAFKALSDLGIRLNGDIYVHLVSDEEIGGFGTRECIARSGKTDGVVSLEPTGLTIAPGVPGSEAVRIEVAGQETHPGNRYAIAHGSHRVDSRRLGVNAIDKTVKIITAMQELEGVWARTKSHPLFPSGFNSLDPEAVVGGSGGGRDGRRHLLTGPGIVPDYCSMEYNVWYYPGEQRAEILSEIEAHLMEAARSDDWLAEHPPKMTPIWSTPPFETPVSASVVNVLADALTRFGTEPQISGFPAGSDIVWYGAEGVVFGPGRITEAHGPNEFVRIDDVVDGAITLTLFMIMWSGGSVDEVA